MRRWGVLAAVTALVLGLAVAPSNAGAADLNNVTVRLTPLVTKLKAPLGLVFRQGDVIMYVVEQGGRIRPIFNGKPKGKVVKVTASTGGERGLLGATFSPNGQKLYVSYTEKTTGHSRIDEYTMSGRTAVKSSRRPVFFQQQPFANHNGGQITFGPDGYLYVFLGDGGGAGDPQNNAQRLDTVLGKILRINPNANPFASYSIPSDNPFFNTPGARKEIWMYGLRNPWRGSFDRLTGDFWVGDVGQQAYEEIDFAPAGDDGINWGWRLREGFHQYAGAAPPGARDPIIERPQSAGDCAIVGGYVYRGTRNPNLNGAYVYGDACTGIIRAAVQTGGVITQSRALPLTVPGLTSFGEDPNGELYAVSGQGTVYRIDP
jgi:glucose/arabinose dehydrogenase